MMIGKRFIVNSGIWRNLEGALKSRHLGRHQYTTAITSSADEVKPVYDVVIVGAGHNGLISAAYLAKHGLSVGVFERRHVLGGAAVTEEIVPGYKFTRGSYVFGLMRPQIIKELELKKHGLKVYARDVGAFTPILEDGVNGNPPRSLSLYSEETKTVAEISKFSKRDAEIYASYGDYMKGIIQAVTPLLDHEPLDFNGGFIKTLRSSLVIRKIFKKMGSIPSFYEFVTAPISKTLNKWFESDVLKATLATDAITGAMLSPDTPGSSYVLLHHKIGEVDGLKGTWGFPEGGMGAVSLAIAKSAKEKGADIFTSQKVRKLEVNSGRCSGITLEDGKHIQGRVILSNATPHVTFQNLLTDHSALPEEYRNQISSIDYSSPVTKINVAVDRIPNFLAIPNKRENEVGGHHASTIHLNCETMSLLDDAFMEAKRGGYSERPMIEMCIPSSMDPTLAPKGHHVVSLFTQYTPYYLNGSEQWSSENRTHYRDTVFDSIEEYAPGFKNSVVDYELLTPQDLEDVFGLTGGNIFHGAMSLDQLYVSRPTSFMASQRTPLAGLYLCGSGTHPGGGVMGAPGRLAALAVLSDFKMKKTDVNLKRPSYVLMNTIKDLV